MDSSNEKFATGDLGNMREEAPAGWDAKRRDDEQNAQQLEWAAAATPPGFGHLDEGKILRKVRPR
jgi:hypothetical protein